MKIPLLLLILAAIFTSCKRTDKNNLEKTAIQKANWILGKWAGQNTEGTLSENWTKLNDSTFQAKSYFIKIKDTLHFESITLEERDEKLSYKATVQGQNNNKAVTYRLTLDSINKLVFENPQQDYPQKITYTLINKDSLVASISGLQLGKQSTEIFGMKRVK